MSLQIDIDDRFSRRERRFQRAGWVAIATVIVAAAAGLLGPGPLSHSQAVSPDGAVRIHYLRFARQGGAAGLRIEVEAPVRAEGRARVWVDREYVAHMRVDAVVPEPAAVVVDGDELRYEFAVDEASRLEVELSLTPSTMGRLHGSVRAEGRAAVHFDQLVYP